MDKPKTPHKRKNVKCTVPDCDRQAHARGLCITHYGQLWRTGKVSNAPLRSKKRMSEPEYREKMEARNTEGKLKEEGMIRKQIWDAKLCYENALTVENRLKWKHKVKELEAELAYLLKGKKK